jgi:hypothetical protein
MGVLVLCCGGSMSVTTTSRLTAHSGQRTDRGGTGKATSHQDNDALAANVVAALESKLKSADPEMVLVLDANDAPAYTDDPRVVEIAHRTMSERGLLGRWSAVWLVGPTTKRTTRIDPVVRPQLVDHREVPPQPAIADDLGG